MDEKNNQNQPNKPLTRTQKIEEFLMNPDKVVFESIEEFSSAVHELLDILSAVDISKLETLQGEDGKTPVRGVDYFTEEDIAGLEAFILSKIPKVGEDVPSVLQVEAFIKAEVAKIPRVKGDAGEDGKDGERGEDGSPDSAEDIIRKLRTLPKNQRLKITDVRGLENVLKNIIEEVDTIGELKETIEKIRIVVPANGEGGGGNDANAIHTDGEDEFTGIAEDATPAAGDLILAERASDGVKIVIPFSAIGDGVDGRTVLNGAGAPTAGDGVDGDFWIRTSNWTIYGPKTAGAWGSATSLIGPQGPAGAGTGDMIAAVYDPGNVADDAFDMENMTEGATKKILTTAERAKLANISVTQAVDLDTMETQAAAGAAAKVKTDFITVTQPVDLDAIETNSNASKVKTDWLTVTQAVDLDVIEARVNDLDAAVVLRGAWDASAGTFPGGGTAQAGSSYIVSVAGTVNGVDFALNDRIVAIVDNASTGTYAANWLKLDYTDQVLSVVGLTGAISKAALQAAIDLSGVNSGNETTTTIGALINGATGKTTPVDADYVGLMDSAASNILKKLSWANIKATLKTYFDTLYEAIGAVATHAAVTATHGATGAVVGTTNSQVLTGKTLIATSNVTEEITTTASSATPTPTGGSLRNLFTVTAQAAAGAFAAPSGTPANGNRLVIRVKDNGTARALTYDGIYRAIGVTLPTTTVISKTLYLGCIYNSTDSKWDVIAYAIEA